MTSDEKFYSSSETMPVPTTQSTQAGTKPSTSGSDQNLPDAVSANDGAVSTLLVREQDAAMLRSLPPSVISALSEVVDRDFNVVGYSLEAPCPIDEVRHPNGRPIWSLKS